MSRPLARPALRLLLIAAALFLLTGCGSRLATTNWAGLSTDGRLVYLAFGPQVLAYDPAAQAQAWIHPAASTGAAFFAAPAAADGRVVFGDYGHSGGLFSPRVTVSVYALQEGDSAGASQLWVNTSDARDKIVAPALQVGEQVFLGTADNHILALDATSGRLQWDYQTGHAIWGQPAFRDGTLYVASMDHSVYALDAATGELKWSQALGGALPSGPTLGDGLLYVSSFDGNVHALDMATGEERWAAPSADNWVWGAPALLDGTLYFGDIGGTLYAVDAATGEQKWTQETQNAIQTSPVVSNDTLYVASQVAAETPTGALTAYNVTDGTQLWSEPTTTPLYATPVVVEDALVVSTQDANALLIGYDLANGQELWRYALPQTSN
ncbi:MAG TPA: PQQ-binding-like beta-propeller repeat protein [Promineifilum sp.]|nr:PQQ-binding-like beta-propeller repeat protein [Promineifilum sp.]